MRSAHRSARLSLARAGDVPELVDQLLTYPGAVRSLVAPGLAGYVASNAVLIVRRAGGGLAGSMGLRRSRWLWSGLPYLIDDWTYAPGGGLLELVQGARAVASRAGLALYLCQTSGERPEAMRRLMRGLGARDMGGIYLFSGAG